MESSEDEADAVPKLVSNYYFVDDKEEPISFCVLPICWNEDENPDSGKEIFLHGTADSGLQKIYKKVVAWKFKLSDKQPRIWVLTKEKNWIQLQKPRKSFEDTVRTILITLHVLHFLRKNPEPSGKSLWDHLKKVFSLFELRPSENDLLDHLALISDAVKHDETLAKSKFLLTCLQNPVKLKAHNEDVDTGTEAKRSKFIVDDDEELDEDAGQGLEEDVGIGDEDESDEEEDKDVCSLCDNGGEMICCEGRCLRSFHATVDDGTDSDCKSLGFSKTQVKAIQNFLCKNCQYKQHQCYACGKLGSSDKASGAEVFSCVSATCGYFYHPECVARLLYPENEAEAAEQQKKISSGESFTCPVHKCLVCKERENEEVAELQFAMCRRCPRAYHRKCLPRRIAFEDSEDGDIVTRAWENLLPNRRILIYCLKHKMDMNIGTPKRNHIIFPNLEEKKTRALDPPSGKAKILQKRKIISQDSISETPISKKPKQFTNATIRAKDSSSSQKIEKHLSGEGYSFQEKPKTSNATRKLLKDGIKPVSVKMDKPFSAEDKKQSESAKSYQQEVPPNKFERNKFSAPPTKRSSVSRPLLDAEMKMRISSLKEKVSSQLTLEEVIRSHKVPSTHSYSSKHVVDKTITQGKIEAFVGAIQIALQKSEEGCSIEDVEAVCGPQIVNKILKWRNKLKVYLAPFLHGMRYTSFGRHFTKVDKLKEIVDKLHSYVENGDTIVDFCCGANDFSWLMKEKLEKVGKSCLFKNYDVIQPKNDFNFEKRDWMTIRTKELPTGSRLIMGLNPPFGVRAALANKFIDKALEFRPKILILIVPQETERLDEKEDPYDLVWEDNDKLSGKSFYLPGSVDVNDNQMEQWNLKPPLLYLWSRPDWTAKHKEIALKEGHLYREASQLPVTEQQDEKELSDHSMDISPVHDYYGDISKLIKEYGKEPSTINDLPAHNEELETRDQEVVLRVERGEYEDDLKVNQVQHGDENAGDCENRGRGKRSFPNASNGQEKNNLRSKTVTPPKNQKYDSDRPQASNTHNYTPPRGRSPLEGTDSRNSLQDRLSVAPPDRIRGEEEVRSIQPNLTSSSMEINYGGSQIPSTRPDDIDEITRRYSLSSGGHLLNDPNRWVTGTSLGQEYNGIRSSEEQFSGYRRDQRGTFVNAPYLSEVNPRYGLETDTRKELLRLYGQQGMDPSELCRLYGVQNPDSSERIGGYLPNQNTGLGIIGSVPSTLYGSTSNSSAIHRYVPNLDGLSHIRPGPIGVEPPQMGGRSGIIDNAGPQYPLGPSLPGFRHDPTRFPHGPPRPFQ